MNYSEDLRIGMILCGGTGYCYSQEELDTLVSELQSHDTHIGVVISGYKPWFVSVVLKKKYSLFEIEQCVGKYFKCIHGPERLLNTVTFVDEQNLTTLLTYKDGGLDEDDGLDYCQFIEVVPEWKEV